MTWTSDEKLMSPPVATVGRLKREGRNGVKTENGGYLRNDNSFPSEYYVSGVFSSPFLCILTATELKVKWRLLSGDELNPVICDNRTC